MITSKVLLVGANDDFLQHIQSMLQEVGFDRFICTHSYLGALEMLVHETPDLLITDIVMQGNKSGVDLIQWSLEKHPVPAVIVSSVFSEEWLDRVATLSICSYLVNPLSPLNIYVALKMAYRNFHGRAQSKPMESQSMLPAKADSIFVKESSSYIRVDIQQIQYVESHENYVKIYLQNKRTMTIRSTMKEILDMLQPTDFVRISRSHIVRIKSIDKIAQGAVCLQSTKLPIGKTYKEQLFTALGIRNGGILA